MGEFPKAYRVHLTLDFEVVVLAPKIKLEWPPEFVGVLNFFKSTSTSGN
jgi:hypothetical protein